MPLTTPIAAQAAFYISHYGSASAALAAVDQPGHNDAFDRAVCQELRALRHIELTANVANSDQLKAA